MATNLTQSDGDVVTNDRAQCASSGIAYCRLSPQLSVEVDLDETDDAIVRLKFNYFDCISKNILILLVSHTFTFTDILY